MIGIYVEAIYFLYEENWITESLIYILVNVSVNNKMSCHTVIFIIFCAFMSIVYYILI